MWRNPGLSSAIRAFKATAPSGGCEPAVWLYLGMGGGSLGSVLGLELGLQLAVGSLFEVEFQALAAFAARIAGARAVFFEASAKEKDRLGVVRIAVKQGAKGLGCLVEVAALPERIAQVEVIVGIGRIPL